MRKFAFSVFTLLLTACSSTPPPMLTKIDSLEIPVVQNISSTTSPAEMTSLHQENKSIIDNLTLTLKTDYLLDVKTADIFDDHSQAHQVYQTLSKLDQIRLVNNLYLKEKNMDGLVKVNSSLVSLVQG
ncbi:hypothetical protein U0026_08885 [Kluyvera intermedia]|jgi:hypothetical protein|uniref:hypothetical protein n=1 Tax=Kluyvera intermedia TaxID=61648 RepID=UPI000788587A|nr:hypothetical protein [Kluyvera intermedia]WQD31329.1 hypothetical protein U0026_08885 [Kluyvera intermedia]VDZ82635.1 Uncharacterised protein [Kluyvera intermedia]